MQISHEVAEEFFNRVSSLVRKESCNLSMNRGGVIHIQHPNQDAMIRIEAALWAQGYRYKPYIPKSGAGTQVYSKGSLSAIVRAKLEILLLGV